MSCRIPARIAAWGKPCRDLGCGHHPSKATRDFYGEHNMNAVFKAGSSAHLYVLPTSPITQGKGQKMIATGSKEMKEDFYKGLALTALLYGLLVLTSVLTAL